MNNYAILLEKTGRMEEAEGMYRQVLEGRRKVLGEEHVDTLMSMNRLAALLMQTGRMEEAEGMFRQVLEVRRKVLGEDHPHTLKVKGILEAYF